MTTFCRFGLRLLAISLSFLIAFPVLDAQAPPALLNIVVVEGEGAINNARQRVTHDPVVRVEDENHKPIVGAAVVFTLPTEGATGEFGNGGKNLTVMTDDKGQATARGLRLNGIDGKVPIHITASYRGLTASTTMTQFSVLPPGAKPATSSHSGGHGALIAVLVAVGAAAAGGGAYLATHKSGNTATGPTTPGITPIGITPGTGTIVGGH
jgi:hypothetical protein